MSSIDERAVNMKFDNAQFEHGIKTTIASLEALARGLKLDGATKGLTNLSAAGKSVQLGHISSAVDGIAHKFEAMSVIAITALATIVHSAFTSGLSIVKSLTVDPVRAGLREYETNLNSIQTILSNTQWQNTGLKDVNAALQTLNEYSDKTIYNFSQMARNIGTFTAAGVKLDVAVAAIKGIANLAAISGSSAEQASSAMYQLSQALATGTLKLIDWNSVVNAGMGGKVFQDALMETARVHGVAIDKMVKDAGGFRGSLEKGWLTSKILTETLSKFTGDLTAQQLKTMGYNNQQIAGILKMGKTAQDAATKVKTVSQLIGTLQEAAGSGWAKTWQLIFGDFDQAKALFTDVNNTLGAFITTSADARNKVLGDWNAMGGRTVLIEAIGNAFKALLAVVKPIKDAFREMFPTATGNTLYYLTLVLRNFTEGLLIGAETADKLRRTFAGVFAVLGIGWDIIKRLAVVLFDLFAGAGEGASSFLEITANIGDFLVALRRAINDGEGLTKFFEGLGAVLSVPIKLLSYFAKIIASMFDGFDASSAAQDVVGFVDSFDPFGALANTIAFVWGKVVSTFDNVWTLLEPLASKFSEWFQEISDAVGGLNFETLLHAVNTGALVGFVVVLRNIFSGGKSGGISAIFGELTSTLKAMQTTLHATTLLEIALAIGVLAVSIAVLSKIDADGLTKALAAIAIMFAQLLGALAVLQLMPGAGIIRLYAMAASLVVLGVAIGVLAISVKTLSDLSWEELLKGLVGVSVLLVAIVAAANVLPDGARLISTGLGLLVLSAAIKVLASAVNDLSGLDWDEMAKGLTGVGVLLGSLALFSKFAAANAGGVLAGAGIILLAVGIKILASAVKDISSISWENVGKGMAVLAVSLVAIAGALILIPPYAPLSAAGVVIVAAALLILADAIQSISGISWENVGKGMAVLAVGLILISAALIAIPPTAPLSAAGVLIVALAIGILADALTKMGSMSWSEIAKGLTTLAVALTIITVALLLLPSALPGAFALIIVAGALLILSGVLLTLGNMSWGEIAKGLGALALAFVVLGVAAALLTPVIPAMLGLGAAIALIGIGLAFAGAGVFLFAAGLTALSIAGAAGAAAIVAIVAAVIGLIPMLVEQLGIALILLIKVIAEAAPEIVKAVVDILVAILDGLEKIAPKLVSFLLKLLLMLLVVLEQAIPKMVQAGLRIVIGILEGIRDNIGKVVKVGAEVVIAYLRGIGDNLPSVIQAGVDLILKFIKGLTAAIKNNSKAMGDAGGDLAVAIINGLANGLRSGAGRIAQAAKDAALSALHSAMSVLGISSPSKEFMKLGEFSGEGLALGLRNLAGVVKKTAAGVGRGAIDSLRNSLSSMSELVRSDMDLTPTITPVLDLSNVKKNAETLGSLLSTKPITLDATYSSAKQASAGYQNNQDPRDDDGNPPAASNTYNYTQNNTSPKALSTAEIYRQTKNQLSTAKGGLPT